MAIARNGTWIPRINASQCSQCGLCRLACPGQGFDFPGMQLRLFGAPPEHPEIGHYLGLFSGHCTDHSLRWKGQSGGIVSTLLIHLLETNAITGALVVRRDPANPMEAEPFIAHTREEVLQSTGSKYIPVPTGKLITTLLKDEGRFAVVGPSCLIHSIRKAEALMPALSSKIHIRIGLFCLNVFTLPFHEYLRARLKLKPGDIQRFEHRSKEWRGWPGNLRIWSRTGTVVDLEAQESRIIPRPFFGAWRCNLCIDKANEFADISCGDCRVARHYGVDNLSNLGHSHPGLSDIIVRTDAGRRILEDAITAGRIQVKPSTWKEIADSVLPAAKKLGFEFFSRHALRKRWGIPDYGIRYLPTDPEAVAALGTMTRRTRWATAFHVLTFELRRYSWYPRLLARIPSSFLRRINRLVRQNSWHEVFGKSLLQTVKESP